MDDGPDKGECKGAKQPSRQDRLKLALRENLKRRKSQARGRSDTAVAAGDAVDASLSEPNEE
jgi:hypothetical protein